MSGFGSFVWYELMTRDKKPALAFYHHVIGWTDEDAGQPGVDYTFLTINGTRIGGAMTLPDEACKAGARPIWLGYIGVGNTDDCAVRVAAKGGRIHRPPQDIPGYGRFAVLADPQGAVFCIISSGEAHKEAPPAVHRPCVPGFGGWHELYADDLDAAFEFYAGVFGWTKDQAVDLGEMGVYQLFAINGVQSGGMMRRPAGVPTAAWNYYFNVDGIDAAAGRVRDAGGQICMGPHQVPGGAWILMARDPQEAPFSLVSPTK